jgi:hypothetical protein
MQRTIPIPAPRALTLWRSLIVLLVTAAAFDLLFWKQDIGINLPLYAVLITGALLGRYGWKGLSLPARAVMAALLVACFFTVWYNSVVAIITGFVCLFVFAALAHEVEVRSLYYGIAQAVTNYALSPFGASRSIGEALEGRRVPRAGWRWFKLALIPLALLVIYFQIYRVANPKFDHLTAGFLDSLSQWLDDLFSEILTPHTIFFAFAVFLSAGLLFRFAPRMLADHEKQWTELLLRRRVKRPHWLAPASLNPLERERKTGVILLVMMNVLLAVVKRRGHPLDLVRLRSAEGFLAEAIRSRRHLAVDHQHSPEHGHPAPAFPRQPELLHEERIDAHAGLRLDRTEFHPWHLGVPSQLPLH